MQTDNTGKLVDLCRERASGYGALRQSSLTAVALDRAADTIERQAAEIAELRASLRTAMNDLQAHKDALAQAEPKP